MTTATITDIELMLAREAYGTALLASIDGTGSEAAVEAAGARLDRAMLMAERAVEFVPSAYATNYR